MEKWISFEEEVMPAILRTLKMPWRWASNPKCKYISVRIDMRDGHCLLSDRHGNVISIEELEHQHKSKG